MFQNKSKVILKEAILELKEISLKDKELFKDIGYVSSDYIFSYIYVQRSLQVKNVP